MVKKNVVVSGIIDDWEVIRFDPNKSNTIFRGMVMGDYES